MRGTSRDNAICLKSIEEEFSRCPETYRHTDLICFGFPCQGISIANRKAKGLSDSRSNLFFQAMRIVKLVVPKWILIENVPRLLSINKGFDFAIVLQTMAKIGYGYQWRILDSKYFGVAQQRRRLFIIGCFGEKCPPEILFEQKSGIGDIEKDRKMEPVGLCISSRDGERQDPSSENIVASVIKASDYNNQPIGQFGNENNLVARTIGTEQRGVAGRIWEQTYIAETNPNGKGAIAGVPDRFHKNRGIVLGNAVTVNVAQWIGERIMAYEAKQKNLLPLGEGRCHQFLIKNKDS